MRAKKEKPEYGSCISYLIDEANETQDVLAKAIGVNRDKVNNWINGRTKLDADHLLLIADHYHVSTDYILKGGKKTSEIKVLAVIEETGLSEEASENLYYEFENHPDRQALLNVLLKDIDTFEKMSVAYSSACTAYNKLNKFGDIVAGLNDDLTYNDLKHFNLITNDQATRFHTQDAVNHFHELLKKAIEKQFAEKYGEQLTKEINEQCKDE